MRASAVLSRQWLIAAGAPPALLDPTCEDVRARLDDLPDLMGPPARFADTLLGLLPPPLLRTATRLPGVSEFARIVESLTAVSYLDAVGKQVVVPAQRQPGAGSPAAVESPA